MLKERGLGGVVEAALDKCMADQEWLQTMANDPAIAQTTPDQVFETLEDYITEVLADKTNN